MVALSVSGCLEQKGDLTRWRAACVSNINTGMCLLQTQKQDVPDLGAVTKKCSLSPPHTHTLRKSIWFSDKHLNFKQTYSQTSTVSLRKAGKLGTESLQEICNSLQLLARWFSGGSSSPLAWLPPTFFALYGHKSWLSKRERERVSGSEDGGVVYCFWRKRCRVTCCS